MFDGPTMMAFEGHSIPSAQCYGRAPGVWCETRRQYDRARRESAWRRLWSRVTGCSARLENLGNVIRLRTITHRRELGLLSVPLTQIVGSEGRSRDFDAAFGPAQTHSRTRWMRIAAAFLCDEELPPVSLIQVGDHYYVRDGHHRISVSRAFGRTEIDAIVISWDGASHGRPQRQRETLSSAA